MYIYIYLYIDGGFSTATFEYRRVTVGFMVKLLG